MGTCLSTAGAAPNGDRWRNQSRKGMLMIHDRHHPKDISLNDQSADYDEDLDNKSIIQGLAGAYKVLKLLGTGAEGTTYLVEDVADGKQWAIKLIKLPLPTRFVQAITREIKLQSELGEGHQGIVTTEEVVLTSHYLGLVMEFAAGGALTAYLSKKMKENKDEILLLQEDEARYLFRQIANAVDFCHRYKVVHRDLKLDNILITHDDPPIIKLCDFGFAKGWRKSSHFTTVIGTPDYMSPQITAANATGKQDGRVEYDGTKADVWAMGVLLYVMLVGKFPFEGSCVSEMEDEDEERAEAASDAVRKIWEEQNKRSWDSNKLTQFYLPYFSDEVKDLLGKMFEMDEKKRIDVATIRRHPWFRLPLKPKHQEATQKLEEEQQIIDRNVEEGAYCSKSRNQAIDDLLALAASEEFKRRASEPITAETTFQIWSRISLRTQLDSYHVPNKKTLQQLIAESYKLANRRSSTRSISGPPSSLRLHFTGTGKHNNETGTCSGAVAMDTLPIVSTSVGHISGTAPKNVQLSIDDPSIHTRDEFESASLYPDSAKEPSFIPHTYGGTSRSMPPQE